MPYQGKSDVCVGPSHGLSGEELPDGMLWEAKRNAACISARYEQRRVGSVGTVFG